MVTRYLGVTTDSSSEYPLHSDPAVAAEIHRALVSPLDFDAVRSFDTLTQKLGREPVASRHPRLGVRQTGWSRMRTLGVSAGLVAAALVVAVGSNLWPGAKEGGSRTAATVRDYATRRAQQAQIDLPDGSRVVLAPETKLRYLAGPDGSRTVELQGQAYFTVTHDGRHPFIVRTATSTTRVLGTAFVVRAYPTDRAALVSVTEGKVAVGRGVASTVLLAGDIGRVAPDAATTVTHGVSSDRIMGWTRGELAFETVPLSEVALELERLYDLDIAFADPALTQRRVSITFSKESETTVLQLITLAVDAKYTRQGRAVVLSSR